MYFSNNKRVQKLMKLLVFLRSSQYTKKHNYVQIQHSIYTRTFLILTFCTVLASFLKIFVFIHIYRYGTTMDIMSSMVTIVKYFVLLSFRVFQISTSRNKEVVYFMKQMERQERVLADSKCKY